MSDNDILVVGYPKSGNTWLSRLLGDILDCRVTGYGTAHPLAEEGQDRPGRFAVRQLHLRPSGEAFAPNFNAWKYSVPNASGEKIALIVRDPRDVVVSCFYYWQMSSKDEAINAVMKGKFPIKLISSWTEFYKSWLDVNIGNAYMYLINYDTLLKHTRSTLLDLLKAFRIEDYDRNRFPEAIERQEFSTRRNELKNSGSKYNYGATIQIRNLRGGRSGDWKNELTDEQAEYIRHEVIKELGLERVLELGLWSDYDD